MSEAKKGERTVLATDGDTILSGFMLKQDKFVVYITSSSWDHALDFTPIAWRFAPNITPRPAEG